MAKISPWLDQKFYLADGITPNAAGKLFTYESGTSTKKQTLDDVAGSPNTNPIILNSAGECDLYLEAGEYKIVNAPFNDTDPPTSAIKTWNDVVSSGASGSQGVVNTIAELKGLEEGAFEIVEVLGYNTVGDAGSGLFRWASASSSSDNGGTIFIPTITTGNGRWFRAYDGALNAGWWGLVGDGATVENTAFDNAITLSATDKQDLYIPTSVGGYLLTSTLTFTAGSKVIMAEGAFFDAGSTISVVFNGEFNAGASKCFGSNIVPTFADSAVDFVRPEWFGAVVDGSIDDTIAIQSALTTGENVLFSEGTHKIIAALEPLDGQIIKGAGPTSIIQQTVDLKQVFLSTDKTGVVIQDLAVDFDVTVQTTGNGSEGIEFLRCYDCKVERVKITNAGRFAIYCDEVLSGKTEQLHLITDNHITDSGLYGINLESNESGTVGMTIVEKNYVKNSGALNTTTGRGIIIAGLSNNIIRDNTVDGATEYGIRMFAGTTFPKTNNNIIINNYVKNVGVDTTNSLVFSIYLYAESTGETKNTIIENNTIEDVGLVSINDVGITSGGSDGSIASGNIISGTQGSGINLSTFVDGYNVIKYNMISGITKGITSSYNVSNGNHTNDFIYANVISVSTVGISANAVPYPKIQNNVVTVSDTTTVTAYGIQTSSTVEETISDNRVIGAYVGLQYSSASKGMLFNNIFTGFGAGGEISGSTKQAYTGLQIRLSNPTVDTTDIYYGIYNQNIKTAGATDNSDTIWGLFNDIRINQSGGTVGVTRGLYSQALLIDGTIDPDLMGVEVWGRIEGGTVTDIYGTLIHAFTEGGTVSNDILGLMVDVDVDSAMTSIGGDIYGIYIKIDADKDPVGLAYGLYVDDLSNIDYSIFTKSSAPIKLNGLLEYSSQAGITASVTQTQGQQPLTNTINIISTVANANDAVTLPTSVRGLSVTVHNRGANTLQIFPASDDAINEGSVDASVTLAANTRVVFDAGDAINWYS